MRAFLLKLNTKMVGGSSLAATLTILWTTPGVPMKVRASLSVLTVLTWLGMPNSVKTP